jgi:hypothetical protein
VTGSLWGKVQGANVAARTTATVSTDAELVRQIEEKEVRLAELRRAVAAENSIVSPHQQEMVDLATEVEALHARAKESDVTFVFEGIGRTRYYELLAEQPPTEQQRGMEERNGLRPQPYNMDTFPPALAAECLVGLQDADGQVEPPPDLAARLRLMTEIWQNWSSGVNEHLWSAVLVANQGVMETPKSVIASGILRAFGPSSTTAPPEASPEASSSAASRPRASRTGSRKTSSTRSPGRSSKT